MGRPSHASRTVLATSRLCCGLRWPISIAASILLHALMLLGLGLTGPTAGSATNRPLVATLRGAAPLPPARPTASASRQPRNNEKPLARRAAPARRMPAPIRSAKVADQRAMARPDSSVSDAAVPATTALPPPGVVAEERAAEGRSQPTGSSAVGAARSATAPTAVPGPGSNCTVRVAPRFPREAIEDDVREGQVVARLYPDATGHIVRLDVLGAQPASHARYFERETRHAAARWHCWLAYGDEAVRQTFVFRLEE